MKDYIIVYKEEYPWDVRVEKIAKTLEGLGLCTVIARNVDRKSIDDSDSKTQIKRLNVPKFLPKSLYKVLNSSLFFNPFWFCLVNRHVKRNKTEVIIIRDLPLMMLGIFVGKLNRVPVVFDMAECYPEMYSSGLKFSNTSIYNILLKNPYLAVLYEIIAIKFCDHVFVMIEESRDRLLKRGVSSSKITIVSNTPHLNEGEILDAHHSGRELKIAYVGFLTNLRGLDVLIRAISEFLRLGGSRKEIKVDIIGKGIAKQKLIELVEELSLKDIVTVHGWLPKNEVESILKEANVGALTYRVCSHWNNTIPNKIFDYMKNGLPVLATEVIPIKRIIEETGAGLICRDKDAVDIADKLLQLRDPLLRRHLGSNGIRAVNEKYNWNIDKERMIAVLKKVKAR